MNIEELAELSEIVHALMTEVSKQYEARKSE